MADTWQHPFVAPAVYDANALITACLGNNFTDIAGLLPNDPEGAWLVLTLTKLSAELVKSLAASTNEDPTDLWQRLALEHVERVS